MRHSLLERAVQSPPRTPRRPLASTSTTSSDSSTMSVDCPPSAGLNGHPPLTPIPHHPVEQVSLQLHLNFYFVHYAPILTFPKSFTSPLNTYYQYKILKILLILANCNVLSIYSYKFLSYFRLLQSSWFAVQCVVK